MCLCVCAGRRALRSAEGQSAGTGRARGQRSSASVISETLDVSPLKQKTLPHSAHESHVASSGRKRFWEFDSVFNRLHETICTLQKGHLLGITEGY